MQTYPLRILIMGVLIGMLYGPVVHADNLPPLPVSTLSEKTVVVPNDLPAGSNVLIIGFSKPSRSQIADWSAQLGKMPECEGVGTYRVSVLEKVPRFVRGYVIGKIRKSIPAELHDHYLLVLENSSIWENAANYDGSNDAFVLLLDVDRNVVWRGKGACTPEKLAEIATLIPSTRSN